MDQAARDTGKAVQLHSFLDPNKGDPPVSLPTQQQNSCCHASCDCTVP